MQARWVQARPLTEGAISITRDSITDNDERKATENLESPQPSPVPALVKVSYASSCPNPGECLTVPGYGQRPGQIKRPYSTPRIRVNFLKTDPEPVAFILYVEGNFSCFYYSDDLYKNHINPLMRRPVFF
jgi:hypothetical protein